MRLVQFARLAERLSFAAAIIISTSNLPLRASAAPACGVQTSDPQIMHRGEVAVGAPRASNAEAVIHVALGRDGLVSAVTVARSSGDARLDAAALNAARSTAFAPASHHCVAVDSTFDEAFTASKNGAVTVALTTVHTTTALR